MSTRKTTKRKSTTKPKSTGTRVSKKEAINQRTKKLKPGFKYNKGGGITKVKSKK